ncbi:MAG: hypothetical protein KGI52_16210, partial [Burkholderiales bacterium]|nr:hypothetical protein [Burkholderiales bacterium]
GPYPLPADYLRALNDDVYYTISGVANRMTYALPDEFDVLIQTPGLTGYPTRFMTDLGASPPTMTVWPPPSGSYPVSFRYYRQMPDITTPESSTTVPWFPNTNYLITRLAGEMMKITDDDRKDAFLGEGPTGAQGILNRYLLMKDDHEAAVRQVKLDPRHFGRAAAGLKATKSVGF